MTGHGRQAADTAADAGFECPECHQTARFTADGVLLSGRVGIGPDGWDAAARNHAGVRGMRVRGPGRHVRRGP